MPINKYWIKTDADGIIRDIVSFAYQDYQEITAENIPAGVNGGWYKYENGQIIEVPELKPADQGNEIKNLKNENLTLQSAVTEMTTLLALQEERLSTQENAITELSMIIAGGI